MRNELESMRILCNCISTRIMELETNALALPDVARRVIESQCRHIRAALREIMKQQKELQILLPNMLQKED